MTVAASPIPVHTASVENRPIWVFDGLLDQVATLVQALHRAPFTRTEVATPATPQYRHWVQEIPLRGLPSLPLFQATLVACRAVLPDQPLKVYRAYTNHAAHGDVLMIHTDCLPDATEYTALWYLAEEWDADWGGETVFYDNQRDARFIVSPKPGRLALFHGAIAHAGRPPSRICYLPRYTLALKLEPA